MKTFQLDECLNSKRLANACNALCRCEAHRFPNSLKGKSVKDPEVLEYFFSRGKAIVTNDAAMIEDHVAAIPQQHPGLIIIVFSDECRDELTDEASGKILVTFKSHVPQWSEIPVSNSVLLVTEKSVRVFHKENGVLRKDLQAEYCDMNIAESLLAVLVENKKRNQFEG